MLGSGNGNGLWRGQDSPLSISVFGIFLNFNRTVAFLRNPQTNSKAASCLQSLAPMRPVGIRCPGKPDMVSLFVSLTCFLVTKCTELQAQPRSIYPDVGALHKKRETVHFTTPSSLCALSRQLSAQYLSNEPQR